MTTFLIALGLFALAVAGMAVGVMLGRGGPCGSCGGLSAMRDEQGRPLCESCPHPEEICPAEPSAESPTESSAESLAEVSSTTD